MHIRIAFLGLLATVAAAYAAEPATKPTRPLTIEVLDADSGKPIPSATVALHGENGYDDRTPVDSQSGKATVRPEVEATYCAVMCRAPGYVPCTANWDGEGRKPVELPASLTMRLPKGTTIGGRVVDEIAKPVEKAKVIIWYRPERGEGKSPEIVTGNVRDEKIETDADGRWAYDGFPADAKRVELRVEHEDFIRDGQLSKTPQIAELRDRSAVIGLERGIGVTGQVVSADAKPIAGAKVTTVQTAYVANDYGNTVKTDADGNFRLDHLREGAKHVTVTAKGFAPDIQSIDVKAGLAPLAFKLSPGRTLHGRVVDTNGQAIKDVFVYMRGWRSMAPFTWDGKTDADGKFTMPDCPADAMEFQINKEGYRDRTREMLTAVADGSEVVVTMQPELKFNGKVVDAQTGKPIEKFRVYEGWRFWEGSPPFFMFTQPHDFTGGAYEHKSDAHEQVLAAFVRIEADGYKPAVSPAFRDGGGTFDAQLVRGDDVAETLTSPDGKPLAGASVFLAMPGAQVDIWDMQIREGNSPYAKTDADGRFRFGPQIGDIFFVVIHETGYYYGKGDADAAANDLKLAPWSKIEGTYAPVGKAAAGAGISCHITPIREPREVAPRLNWSPSGGQTDADGKYHIDKVPSFGGETALLMIGRLDSRAFDERRWLPVRLEPGKTLELNVTGGVSVSGRVVPASSGDEIKGDGWVLLTPKPKLPALSWPTDIASAAAQAQPLYRQSLNPDGTFVVPSLLPGRYEYNVTIYAGDVFGSASGTIDVAAANETTDAGEIKYVRGGAVRVGDEAPEVLGLALDDKPIRTADFAGKFVVVALWDSCTGRSDAHLPHLNQLGSSVAPQTQKVALVSLSMDAISCGMTGIPRKPHTLDHSGWLKGYVPLSQQAITHRLGEKKWPAILIIGPDGKVVARDLDGKNVAAKLAEVMK